MPSGGGSVFAACPRRRTAAWRKGRHGLACARCLSATLALLCVFSGERAAKAELPEPLEKSLTARQSIETAVIEWTHTRFEGAGRSGAAPRPLYFTTRLSPTETLRTSRGDEAGVHYRDEHGAPMPVNQSEFGLLQLDDRLWSHQRNTIRAEVHPTGGWIGPENLRSLGVSPMFDHRAPEEILSAPAGEPHGVRSDVEFAVREDGGMQLVERRSGEAVYRWWLDPKRQLAPVRASVEQGGEVVFESRVTLAQFDDVWFPSRVDYFREDYANGERPAETVQVLSAEFNRTDHPWTLGPTDLGIECGMNVHEFDASRGRVGVGKFDGQAVVPLDEYAERFRAGELETGPTYRRILAAGRSRLEQWRRETGEGLVERFPQQFPFEPGRRREFESAWERYTREFIARYRLNDDQSQRAWRIHAECRDNANAYLASKKVELERIDERVVEAATADADDARRRDKLLAALTRLLEPIDGIFESQLKPRLEKLPTRAQRAAAATQPTAAGAPATRPAAESSDHAAP